MSVIKYVSGGTWTSRPVSRPSSGGWPARQAYSSVSIVGSNASANYSSGTAGHTVSAVNGITSGDLSIVSFCNRFNTAVTAPSGWTSLDTRTLGSVKIVSFYRAITGSETWPYTFTSTLSSGYGMTMEQVVFRNATLQAPTVAYFNTGYTTKGVTTGIATPALSGSYALCVVGSNTIRAVEGSDFTVIQNTGLNNTLLVSLAKPLKTLQSFGSDVRFSGGLLNTFVCQTYIISPKQ